MKGMPQILTVRQQAEVIRSILSKRLDTIVQRPCACRTWICGSSCARKMIMTRCSNHGPAGYLGAHPSDAHIL